MNVGVILAAGNSTRFQNEVPKQLYSINNKPIINHSIDILGQCLDEVIIVTNTYCYDKIKTHHTILINDVDDRIESIKVALDYIGDKKYNNILIHDVARPFITTDMISELLESSKTYKHSQYYLELVNGLVRKNDFGWEVAPREDFIEICSPQITEFELFKYIFNFCIWLFIYFLPWLGQYFECAFEKIVSLPKCFFWYILECISWVVYLPFRIVFWLIDYLFNIGLEQLIHDYFWCILEDIDKFIHDEGEGSLGTGIHIIHFPDSVMDKCYNCHIKPIGKKMPSTCNLNKKYCKFINCKNGNKCISTKCNAQINQYMEKPKSEGDTETNM